MPFRSFSAPVAGRALAAALGLAVVATLASGAPATTHTTAPATNYATLPVTLGVNNAPLNVPPVRLIGPGQITALDPPGYR